MMNKEEKKEFYKKLIKEHFDAKISLTKLSRKYMIGRDTIAFNFKKLGFYPINYQNLINFNENVFDYIDTEEKSYWLGFIYADGTISSKNINHCYQFELGLKLSDKCHLEKFKKFLCWNKNIITDSYRCRVVFNNKHLWTILNNYGCTPNKSLTLEFPNEKIFSSKKLIRHFLRGYFDGDGCISYCKHIHIVSIASSVLGTPEFLNSFEKYIGLKNVTRSHDERHSIHTQALSFKINESVKLINFLYNDSSIYLDRKYKRYEFFKDSYSRPLEELSGLLESNIGEDCDVNTEINSEISKGSESS